MILNFYQSPFDNCEERPFHCYELTQNMQRFTSLRPAWDYLNADLWKYDKLPECLDWEHDWKTTVEEMFDTVISISNKVLIKLIKQRGCRVFCLIAQAQNNHDRITCVTSFSYAWLHLGKDLLPGHFTSCPHNQIWLVSSAEQQWHLEFLYSHLKCLFMMSQI